MPRIPNDARGHLIRYLKDSYPNVCVSNPRGTSVWIVHIKQLSVNIFGERVEVEKAGNIVTYSINDFPSIKAEVENACI